MIRFTHADIAICTTLRLPHRQLFQAISFYLAPNRGGGNYGCLVDIIIDVDAVHVDAEVLVWSDIVCDSMANSIAATCWQLVRTAWIYITTSALWRLMKLRKGPVLAALYPVGMLLIQLLLACLAFYVAALLRLVKACGCLKRRSAGQ